MKSNNFCDNQCFKCLGYNVCKKSFKKDINSFFNEDKNGREYSVFNADTLKEVKVTAKSPIEAVKKVFNTDKVKRTYSVEEGGFYPYKNNEGNIVVTRFKENGCYGASYTYSIK